MAEGRPVTKLEEEKIEELVSKAQEARDKAYAPYSQFKVGAALLTSSGEIFTGKTQIFL